MTTLPRTRETLLLRLADAGDAAAWDEFVAIYRPMILRLGLQAGLQPNDADDLAQRVLMSVSRAIGDWESDPSRCTFRTWLRKVVRNAIINMLQRGPRVAAVGGSEFVVTCQAVESPSAEIERLVDAEYERHVLRTAAARVQQQVTATVWQAFWRTTMQSEPIQAVADDLQISVGKVYGARSRVLSMLQRAAAEISDDS